MTSTLHRCMRDSRFTAFWQPTVHMSFPCLQGAPLTMPAGSSSAAAQMEGPFITTKLDELNPQLLYVKAVRDMSAAECGSIWKVGVLGDHGRPKTPTVAQGSVRHDTCGS